MKKRIRKKKGMLNQSKSDSTKSNNSESEEKTVPLKPDFIVYMDNSTEPFDEFMNNKFHSEGRWCKDDYPPLRVLFSDGRVGWLSRYLSLCKGKYIIQQYGGWYWYSYDTGEFNPNACGKWMYFFSNQEFAQNICKRAIEEMVCLECKCTDMSFKNDATGVVCFYTDAEDIEGHKAIISFMLDNDLIRKTKSGRYFNISFKLDSQTRNGEYGNKFDGEIHLSDFVDLVTGEFIK